MDRETSSQSQTVLDAMNVNCHVYTPSIPLPWPVSGVECVEWVEVECEVEVE